MNSVSKQIGISFRFFCSFEANFHISPVNFSLLNLGIRFKNYYKHKLNNKEIGSRERIYNGI